jgi:enterochelin esterase-like enzyme
MKTFRYIMCVAACLCAAATMAQKVKQSTICNADGTVTFKYENPNAKDVQVDVQFAGRNPMTKGADGVWTATLGPAAPDMYPYCFVVDGVSVMDPLCPQYFPNEGFKNSLLEIPAKTGSLAHDIKNVPHGKVEYIHYYSKSLKGVNNAIVYLPPKYDTDKNKKYPVFYLLSGTTDTEEVYYKVGRVNYILDNLIAEGKAVEMIVVLPYGNPTKLLPPAPAPAGGFGGFGGMGMMRDVVGDDITGDLMNYVENHYRTINDRDHRGIGGFSRGGNQGLGIGLRNLDKFSYLCSYSSFTATEIPGVYDNAADTNQKIHLFWLGVGTDDFLFGNARDYMEHLDKHGIRSVKEFTHDKYGHTWMNAKYFLDKSLRLLFNPTASEEAMKNGKPALERTGQEQQFTGATMARLFPRQVTSPEYAEGKVTFRLNAPEAKSVQMESELLSAPVALTRGDDGVWSVTLTDHVTDVYKYCFVVDGTKIADPTNMYLSPDKGFKYSIAYAPSNPFDVQVLGDINFGKVVYDLNQNVATYFPPTTDNPAVLIQLIPGNDDTMESWFKVGSANLIADKLLVEGKTQPCILTTSTAKDSKMKTYTLKASDYKNWAERRKALEKLLLSLK